MPLTPPLPLWIPASARMTNSESGTCFGTNRSCRLVPAHQGMKSRSCGLVQRIGAADSATPHPDPSGGQAPALHFLIPPSTIGLQFGTFRRWRAGIEVDLSAHFRTNDEAGAGGIQAYLRPRDTIFVPKTGEFPRPQAAG